MRLTIPLIVFSYMCSGQVSVSFELVTKGTQPMVGAGLDGYTWNVLACAVGPLPVPFVAVRQAFPEVRLYSADQQAAILQARVSRSWQARTANVIGYAGAAVGAGIQIEQTLKKSPAVTGTVVSVSGLALPLITSLVSKSTPHYAITNPPPAIIQLAPGTCAEYTALAAFGKAPNVIPPRLVLPPGGKP